MSKTSAEVDVELIFFQQPRDTTLYIPTFPYYNHNEQKRQAETSSSVMLEDQLLLLRTRLEEIFSEFGLLYALNVRQTEGINTRGRITRNDSEGELWNREGKSYIQIQYTHFGS